MTWWIFSKDGAHLNVHPMLDGAPDYTAEQFEKRQPAFLELQAELKGMDISGWPVDQQVDWHLVRAEMNGYAFNRGDIKALGAGSRRITSPSGPIAVMCPVTKGQPTTW